MRRGIDEVSGGVLNSSRVRRVGPRSLSYASKGSTTVFLVSVHSSEEQYRLS